MEMNRRGRLMISHPKYVDSQLRPRSAPATRGRLSVVTSVALCWLVVSAPGVAQEAGRPVPRGWVSHGTLTVVNLNFSVSVPGGWTWRQTARAPVDGTQVNSFTATASEDAASVAVMVYQKGGELREGGRGLQKFARDFAGGTVKSLPAGWRVANTDVSPSDIPAKGSARIRIKLSSGDAEFYQFLYVVPGKYTYVVMAGTPDANEPAVLFDSVRSFRLLDPAANKTDPAANRVDPAANRTLPNVGKSLVFLFALVATFLDWRHVRAGGRRSSRRERLLLAAAVGSCLLFLLVLGRLGATAEHLGELSATLTIWVWGLWEVARLLVRRKYPVRPVMPLDNS
jgi:hypothetical protein